MPKEVYMVIYFSKYMRTKASFSFASEKHRLCRCCEKQHYGWSTYTPRLQNPQLPAPHPEPLPLFYSQTFSNLSGVQESTTTPWHQSIRVNWQWKYLEGKQPFIKSRFKPGHIGLLKKKPWACRKENTFAFRWIGILSSSRMRCFSLGSLRSWSALDLNSEAI